MAFSGRIVHFALGSVPKLPGTGPGYDVALVTRLWERESGVQVPVLPSWATDDGYGLVGGLA